MKLDRNINGTGRGKYALLKLRRLSEMQASATEEGRKRLAEAFDLLEATGILDWGDTPETEFFVMRLKDEYAAGGLSGYAVAAAGHDIDYAREVWDLSQRSGRHHPNCKKPD